MKRFISILVLWMMILSGCSGARSNSEPHSLIVYAAASLTDAFAEMGKAFESSHPGVSVTFNFGGSQNLRTQIEQGAPVDVFASANAKEMDALVVQNMIQAG